MLLLNKTQPSESDLDVSAFQSEESVFLYVQWQKTWCKLHLGYSSLQIYFVHVDYIIHCPKSKETEIFLKH